MGPYQSAGVRKDKFFERIRGLLFRIESCIEEGTLFLYSNVSLTMRSNEYCMMYTKENVAITLRGQALAKKVLQYGYYWPTVNRDASDYARKCDKCQKHAQIPRAPPTEITQMVSPWPFVVWGLTLLALYL